MADCESSGRLPEPARIAAAKERAIRILLAGPGARIARLAAEGSGPEHDLVEAARALSVRDDGFA